MRFLLTLLACLALLGLVATSHADEKPAAKEPATDAPAGPELPAAWHGVWKGRCETGGLNRKAMAFAMELHVEPVEGRRAWTWHIIYGEGEKKQTRPYELVPVAGSDAHYRIDEKNNIVIDAFLHEGTLYSRFEINRVCIDARYTLRDGAIEVSMVTTRAKPLLTTGGDGVPEVKVFEFVGAQGGTLHKQPTDR